MKFVYTKGNTSYIVELIGENKIRFLNKVGKFKGRMPKEKEVDIKELTPIFNTDILFKDV